MSTNSSIECPVGQATVNEIKVRIVAFQVFVITLLYALTAWPLLIVFLVIDFFPRGFGFHKLSLLSQIATGIVRLFSISSKPINEAPKLFAARLGIIFSLVILIFHTGFPTTALVFSLMFSLFAFLEAFIGFCAGCYMHALGEKIFHSSKSILQEHD